MLLKKMVRRYCLILCFLVNVSTIFCKDFEKIDNAYVAIFNGDKSTLTPAPGYVQIATNLLDEYKNEKIPATALNKFNLGLEQYFLYQLIEKDTIGIEKEIRSFKPDSISEPVHLRDNQGKPIAFVNVTVYGLALPQVRNTSKPELVYDGLTSVFEYQASISFKSDAIKFTGNFVLDENSSYFLEYNLKKTLHRFEFNGFKDRLVARYYKSSLQFTSEEFIHTYNSSYENYTQVIEAVTTKFYELLRDMYSLQILDYATQYITPLFHEQNVKFIASYKTQLLKAIIDSAFQFVSAKGKNYFEITPLNFSYPVYAHHEYVRAYKDIKLEGFLNYLNYELTESKIEQFGAQYNIFNTIQFAYPDESDKQAFVSFMVSEDGRQENRKKFKVKSIKIKAVYNSPIDERSRKVYRNNGVLFNGSGFRVIIQLDSFDPIYEFLIENIANDISRVIQNTLSKSA